jgi:hypothetical protein
MEGVTAGKAKLLGQTLAEEKKTTRPRLADTVVNAEAA